jgi:hypothetical protein
MATRVESRLSELEKQQAIHEANLKIWQDSIEERTEFQLEAFASRLESVEGAQSSMNETMTGVKAGLDTIIAKMDKDAAVRDAINGDRKNRKMDAKDYMQMALGILGAIAIILPVVRSFLENAS